jgi:hypothetical protein
MDGSDECIQELELRRWRFWIRYGFGMRSVALIIALPLKP